MHESPSGELDGLEVCWHNKIHLISATLTRLFLRLEARKPRQDYAASGGWERDIHQ